MNTFIQLTISGILLGGVYALMGIGLTMIFGVARIVNFAHGEYLMLGMYASYWAFTLLRLDPYVSLVPIAILTYIAGVVTYVYVIRHTIRAPTNVQVFVTLGISTALQGLALWLWKGDFRSVKLPYLADSLRVGSYMLSIPGLIAFLVSIALTVFLLIFLRSTHTGRAIAATVQDRQAASLMGVNVDRIYNFTFSLGIALAGIAGCLFSPIYPAYPTVGTDMIVVAFVIVVLGGLGNIGGATLGGVLIGMIETWSGYYITTSMKQVVYFIIFVLILLVRPTGLFGKRGSEEVGFR